MDIEIGNIILTPQEMAALRIAILNRYQALTNRELEVLRLNSNPRNYRELYRHINSIVSLDAIGIHTQKPLIGLFHLGNHDGSGKAFRKKFITALYQYVGGKPNIGDYSGKLDIAFPGKQLKNIEGFWELYYHEDRNSFDSPEILKRSQPKKVLGINIEDNGSNSVLFLQSEKWVEGTVEVIGANIILQFRNEKNESPVYAIMNCGSKAVNLLDEHMESMKGTIMYINQTDTPKITSCFMKYFDCEQCFRRYGTREINANNIATVCQKMEANKNKKKIVEEEELIASESEWPASTLFN